MVLLLSAASCSEFRNNGQRKLQFEGDSITFLSAINVFFHYADEYDVAIEATPGATTYDEAPHIAAQAALHPAIEVINLGTNDARLIGTQPTGSLADVTARLDSFAASFSPATCVVFVTIDTHVPRIAANARAINNHIRTTFEHVADWDAAWRASYFRSPGDPHPNAEGRAALIRVADAAIATCS